MKYVILLVATLLSYPAMSQNVKIGGQTLKNMERRWVFDKNIEEKIQRIDLAEMGLQKVGLIYLPDTTYNFRQTSAVSIFDKTEQLSLTAAHFQQIDSVITHTLEATQAARLVYLDQLKTANNSPYFTLK